MAERVLPSWREGAARAALLGFLDAADEIPPEQRVAAFENDGTQWCERPRHTQLDFFVWELRQAVDSRPALGSSSAASAAGSTASNKSGGSARW